MRKKYPDAVIDFIVKKEFLGLVKNNPHLDSVITFDKNTGFKGLKATKKFIKSQKYDLLIDIHCSMRSLYLRYAGKAGNLVNYPKYYMKRLLLINSGVNLYENPEPVYLRYFTGVDHLGIQYDGQRTEVFTSEKDLKFIEKKLNNTAFDQEKPFFVICPGAAHFTKRWPVEGFAQTADYFIEKHGCFIGLLGGKNDKDICTKIKLLMKHKAVNFAGDFSLTESAVLMQKASLVITNDTGMMHMAQSQNTPVTAIFGPTTFELGFFPFFEDSIVVQEDIKCRPCTYKGSSKCPKGHFECMNRIEPEKVISASVQLLREKGILSSE